MSIVKLNNRGVKDATAFGSISSLGSLTLIKKQTASSSANISFVDGSSSVVFDNTYKEYIFYFVNMHPATDIAEFQFNMSTDSGSNYNVTKTTTLFKSRLAENDSIQELGYESGSDLAQSTNYQSFTYAGIRNENDASLSGVLRIFNPSSSTFVKHFISECNYMSKSGTTSVTYNSFIAGYGNTTSSVDAIDFKMSSGNIDSGDILLFGLN
jgi:hypothetical protein